MQSAHARFESVRYTGDLQVAEYERSNDRGHDQADDGDRDQDSDSERNRLRSEALDMGFKRSLRSLLSHGVEVSSDLFPDIQASVDRVSDSLVPDHRVRTFITNSTETQASCTTGGSAETLLVCLSSGLVQLLAADELAFVIGHEMGHFVMGHHGARVGEEDDPSSVAALNQMARNRAAEISADRVGFLASRSCESAFRAILKSASGLGAPHLRFDFAAFSDQLRRLQDVDASDWDALASHPLFSVRCRALALFEMSEPYHSFVGTGRLGSLSAKVMDDKIATDLAHSTGFNPLAALEATIRKGAMWSTLRLFLADSRFTQEEQELLRRLFEENLALRAIEFVKTQSREAVDAKCDEALAEVRGLPVESRESLLRSLESLAFVSGGSARERLDALASIGRSLALSRPVSIRPFDETVAFDGLWS